MVKVILCLDNHEGETKPAKNSILGHHKNLREPKWGFNVCRFRLGLSLIRRSQMCGIFCPQIKGQKSELWAEASKGLLTSQDFAEFRKGQSYPDSSSGTKARELLPTDIWPVWILPQVVSTPPSEKSTFLAVDNVQVDHYESAPTGHPGSLVRKGVGHGTRALKLCQNLSVWDNIKIQS